MQKGCKDMFLKGNNVINVIWGGKRWMEEMLTEYVFVSSSYYYVLELVRSRALVDLFVKPQEMVIKRTHQVVRMRPFLMSLRMSVQSTSTKKQRWFSPIQT